MKIQFKILRQKSNKRPHLQTYNLDVGLSATILDCLNRIKWEQDGTLAFRKNCRNTICGSCSMIINGRSALACKENVGGELKKLRHSRKDTPPTMIIAPLENLPVVKDLVVNMSHFWRKLEAINPYVSIKAHSIPKREFMQTSEERLQLNQSSSCIMCGACYSECNTLKVNSDFVGPHALAKTQRMIVDSRDTATDTRIEAQDIGTRGVWGCTRCHFCNVVCPMGVFPMDQISYIKQKILDRKDSQDSRVIRHRKVLVNLVKQGDGSMSVSLDYLL